MVARISAPSSINRALNYNEQKVQDGRAVLLHADGFLKDADQLNFHEKLGRFKHQISLNDRAKTNSLHISLNFDNADKLDIEKLVEIAKRYMSGIGFSAQPFLVYQHHDAAHPHIHIVTTSIRTDGSRIDTFNLGRNQSETTRKQIERDMGLIKAESKKTFHQEFRPTIVQKAQYGKAETKNAIQNVLGMVINTYKYTSLPELNAILQLYNVVADPGGKNSRIFHKRGLSYNILDEHGAKVGVPIKASAFYNKPTLAYLEARFATNETDRHPHKHRIKTAVDLCFFRYPIRNLAGLIDALKKDAIHTIVTRNVDGVIYGLTYVDHKTKCVFNSSALGKQYSAKAILERCATTQREAIDEQQKPKQTHLKETLGEQQVGAPWHIQPGSEIIDILIQPQTTADFLPGQLTKKGKKRRKRAALKRQ
ncbi:relaxase [Segetibacter sp. 3557_3]|uniref:relaxase/mobilization nuclease domain-containing protein n=1 Tax=Segetibacter sp. 3557_3 TaxID=2547429 RepID=UPI00105900DB|nr:relaxase/mobilization nuclease domain-containing protein [Segetibacter sp. 3557_3]TDH17780.1 relaxase [Segetibacter sp. 3557_3]